MYDVIDPVRLEAEDFGEAAANLIEADHASQGGRAVEPGHLSRRQWNGIEVVVPELPGSMSKRRIETEVSPVAVPLAHCRGVCENRLLRRERGGASEHRGAILARIPERLIPQHTRGIGLEGNRRESAQQAVHQELRCPAFDGLARCADTSGHEVTGESSDSERLIGVSAQGDGGAGRCGGHGSVVLTAGVQRDPPRPWIQG